MILDKKVIKMAIKVILLTKIDKTRTMTTGHWPIAAGDSKYILHPLVQNVEYLFQHRLKSNSLTESSSTSSDDLV